MKKHKLIVKKSIHTLYTYIHIHKTNATKSIQVINDFHHTSGQYDY